MARRIRHLNRIVAFLPLVLLFGDLGRRIDGAHTFRQAHVAANIEKFLAQGLSLKPATYNLDAPFSLFDFPLYQLLVAGLCRGLGLSVLVTARVVSILVFTALTVVLERLLARGRVHPRQAFFCLGLFLVAPLGLFFYSNPMVDGLAVLLSFLCLHAFVRWEEERSDLGVFWGLMAVTGVLSTLVKNPVFLPVCVAVACQLVWRRGWRSLLRPGVLLFGGLILAAVVLFKLYSNAVNGVTSFWAAGEADAHFGSLSDRLRPEDWESIAHTLGWLILNPLTAFLGLLGVVHYVGKGNRRYRGLFLGLLLGALVTILVFFSRNRPHSYYQLPFAFILCFFAGYGLNRLVIQARVAWPRAGSTAAGLLLAVFVAATWHFSHMGFEELAASTVEEIAARGEAIQGWTGPRDFVVYVVDSEPEDWNPSFLYFAKRDGYNLPRPDFSAETLNRIYQDYARRYPRLFVACPARPRVLFRRLEDWGLRLAAAGPSGRLYRMERPLTREP
jgi:hypothetical protein